ncbi:MAG: hypothetical protein Q8S22_06175 [Eubacteriales bacterium]|nr:hypothetical protein [Eubacteriales bacterium]
MMIKRCCCFRFLRLRESEFPFVRFLAGQYPESVPESPLQILIHCSADSVDSVGSVDSADAGFAPLEHPPGYAIFLRGSFAVRQRHAGVRQVNV